MIKQEQYKKIARDFLKREIKSFGSLKKALSDYRCASVAGSLSLYCEIGGLYTTTPEKPGSAVVVKSLTEKKPKARFLIKDLIK